MQIRPRFFQLTGTALVLVGPDGETVQVLLDPNAFRQLSIAMNNEGVRMKGLFGPHGGVEMKQIESIDGRPAA